MIHGLRFSNFWSFAEETEVSFLMDGRATENEKSFISKRSNTRLSKVLAIVGANGAGKTNLLKPFSFLTWFITESFFSKDSHFPISSHALSKNPISKFECEFETDENIYKYTLHISHSKVFYESLQVKTSRLWSTLFTREWNSETASYKVKQRGFGLSAKQSEKAKETVSLISFAHQYEAKAATDVYNLFKRNRTNINGFGRDVFYGFSDVLEATPYYYENDSKRQLMASLLQAWDFGLKDVVIENRKRVDDSGKEVEFLMPFGVHQKGDKEFKLPLLGESSGTQAAYYLLTKIIPVLDNGGTLIYDELEGDLHPLMLEPILVLFFNPKTNPKNAQIIFTTHSIEILNELQKSQIILVEKNESESEAWRLSDMEGVRSDDNFYAKYMSGAYGAVPQI